MSLAKELRNAAEKALKQSNSNKPTELRQIIQTLANFYLEKLPLVERKLRQCDELVSNQTELRLRDEKIEHLNSEITHLNNEVKLKEELNQTKDRLLAAQSASLISQPTFAQAASNAPPTRSTPTNVHQVILKPKQIPGEAEIMPKDVRALFKAHYPVYVLRQKRISVLEIRTGPKAVSVLVESSCQVPLLITDINANNEINIMMTASELHKRNPTIQLDNIDPDIDPKNLVSQLITDNQDRFKLEPSEIYLLATKRPPPRGGNQPRPYTAFFAVSPALFNALSNQRLTLSHSATTATETFHVNHCSHCLEYSHSTTRCPRNKRGPSQCFFKRCIKCSATFTSYSELKSHRDTCNTNSCFHCEASPTRRRVTNHRPVSNQCPIHLDKLNQLKSTTNYDPSCSNLIIRSSANQTGNASQSQTLNQTLPISNTPTSPSSLCSPQTTQTALQKAILNAFSG